MSRGKVIALENLATFVGLPTLGIPTIIYDFWVNQKSVSLENKVRLFLQATEIMSQKEKDDFIEKISNNPNFRSDVIFVLIDVIDKMYVESNVKVLANLTNALAKGEIEANDFFRAGGALRDILYTDLEDLINYPVKGIGSVGYDSVSSSYLHPVGLVEISASTRGAGMLFQLTHLGEIILKYGLNSNFSINVTDN